MALSAQTRKAEDDPIIRTANRTDCASSLSSMRLLTSALDTIVSRITDDWRSSGLPKARLKRFAKRANCWLEGLRSGIVRGNVPADVELRGAALLALSR